MRPLSLIIEGVTQKGSEVYDFTTRTANLTAIISKDIDALKKLISICFYVLTIYDILREHSEPSFSTAIFVLRPVHFL